VDPLTETTADVEPTTPLSPTRSELDSTELEEERESISLSRVRSHLSPLTLLFRPQLRHATKLGLHQGLVLAYRD